MKADKERNQQFEYNPDTFDPRRAMNGFGEAGNGYDAPKDPKRDARLSGVAEDGLEIRTYGPEDGSLFEDNLERLGYEEFWRDVTPGQYFRAILQGPQTKAEERALTEGTDSAGGFTVPAPLSDRILDRLRTQSILGRLGVEFLPMRSKTQDFARISSSWSGSWTAEGSTTSSTDMSFESVQLDAKKFMSITRASRELVEDSIGLERALEAEFMGTFDNALQDAVFVGSTSSNQPVGIAKSSEINSANFGGSTSGASPSSTGSGSWNDLIDARKRLQEDNVDVNPNGRRSRISAVWAPRTEAQFAKLRTSNDKDWLSRPPILQDVPFHATPAMPTTFAPGSLTGQSQIHVGDYSEVIVGVRLEPTLEILRERYANTFELGFLAAARWDVQFAHPAALERIERVST